jgi:hypothetical protein
MTRPGQLTLGQNDREGAPHADELPDALPLLGRVLSAGTCLASAGAPADHDLQLPGLAIHAKAQPERGREQAGRGRGRCVVGAVLGIRPILDFRPVRSLGLDAHPPRGQGPHQVAVADAASLVDLLVRASRRAEQVSRDQVDQLGV